MIKPNENGENILETADEREEFTGERELKVLFEDNHVIVVLKPQGVASCPDESKDKNMLDAVKEYLKVKYSKPGNVYTGLVHRLDRPTSRCARAISTSAILRCWWARQIPKAESL